MKSLQIAIFASGTGSNALNIIDYFKRNHEINVALVLSNNPQAPVLAKAAEKGIDTLVLTNDAVADSALLIAACVNHKIDYVILAGYLRKIPIGFIHFYDKKIINIHPSLLPKFGGKGMFGDKVHQAVLDAQAKETGITIHYVNEDFDSGEVIAQFVCPVLASDNLDAVRLKVQALEMAHFPRVIEKTILDK